MGLHQAATYPAKDSKSEIIPYNQRDHSWNIDEYHNSSEKTWNESTPNGMGLHQAGAIPTYPAKDSKSEIIPYNQRDHSWNIDEYHNSSEKTWNESSPNGMGLHQAGANPTYPAKDSKSEIIPYNQRDHSWNIDEYHNSSEKTWNESSPNGMGLNEMKNAEQEGSLHFMSIQEALDKYRVETHSKIIPYVVRDHAWNFGHHDQTNFYRYRDDAPEGYKDAVEYRVPHPTNQPIPPKVIVDIKEKEEVDDHADEIEEAEKNKTKNATDKAKAAATQVNATQEIAKPAPATEKKPEAKPEP